MTHNKARSVVEYLFRGGKVVQKSLQAPQRSSLKGSVELFSALLPRTTTASNKFQVGRQ